jgi:hypothetical protein
MITGPDGTGPAGIAGPGGMVSVGPGAGVVVAAPGIGSVPGGVPVTGPDELPLLLVVLLDIELGSGKAAEVMSGAWARMVAAGTPSRADGVPSWATAHGMTAREQPRPSKIRFIDPPSGQ